MIINRINRERKTIVLPEYCDGLDLLSAMERIGYYYTPADDSTPWAHFIYEDATVFSRRFHADGWRILRRDGTQLEPDDVAHCVPV